MFVKQEKRTGHSHDDILTSVCYLHGTHTHMHTHTRARARRERERQTDRQTDTQTHRHTDRQTHRDSEREVHKYVLAVYTQGSMNVLVCKFV